eukprot:m.5050 g.5050  ORF g.5050 m.5050 type:complete len:458 (+) comp3186_c0_seq1:225-1598(+)
MFRKQTHSERLDSDSGERSMRRTWQNLRLRRHRNVLREREEEEESCSDEYPDARESEIEEENMFNYLEVHAVEDDRVSRDSNLSDEQYLEVGVGRDVNDGYLVVEALDAQDEERDNRHDMLAHSDDDDIRPVDDCDRPPTLQEQADRDLFKLIRDFSEHSDDQKEVAIPDNSCSNVEQKRKSKLRGFIEKLRKQRFGCKRKRKGRKLSKKDMKPLLSIGQRISLLQNVNDGILTVDAALSKASQLEVKNKTGNRIPHTYMIQSKCYRLHDAVRRGEADATSAICILNPSALLEKNSNGNTALHNAAGFGHVHIVKMILEMGVISHAVTNDAGQTPAQVADVCGKPQVSQYIHSWSLSSPLWSRNSHRWFGPRGQGCVFNFLCVIQRFQTMIEDGEEAPPWLPREIQFLIMSYLTRADFTLAARSPPPNQNWKGKNCPVPSPYLGTEKVDVILMRVSL